jgi:hypothetical protein
VSILKENVVEPMRVWGDETRKVFRNKRSSIEQLQKQLERTVSEAARKRAVYDNSATGMPILHPSPYSSFDRVEVDANVLGNIAEIQ